jgi:MycE methyltransferase N-terminal
VATHDTVCALLAACAGEDEQIAAAARAIGLDTTMDILVRELVDRADLTQPLPGGEVRIALRFGLAGQDASSLIRLGNGEVSWTLAEADRPNASISQQLCEVCRCVFGPRATVTAATRSVAYGDRELADPDGAGRPVFAAVQRLLAALDRTVAPDLAALAVRYGSDKFGLHQHTRHYERHLGPLRDRRLTILEIGVGGYGEPAAGGGSLRMWRGYFPRALVYGLDIWDKRPHDSQRITTIRGDQSDQDGLSAIAAKLGGLDLVIDDGSHVSDHVIASFLALFPHLRPGGLYAIEDVQTSYWPLFGGNGEDLDDPRTSLGFLKTLLDGLNHRELLHTHRRQPQPTDGQITGIHFYRNLVLLEKGVNDQRSRLAERIDDATRQGLTVPPGWPG